MSSRNVPFVGGAESVTPSLAPLDLLVRCLRTGRAKLLVAGLAILVISLAITGGMLGGALVRGLSALGSANPTLLWLAGGAFLGSLIASAGAWRSTMKVCGARIELADACARYGVGSLVNAFAPGGLGGAARVVLFSGTLPQAESRVLTAGGAFAAIGLARAVVSATLLAAAVALGAFAAWPVLVLAGLGASGAILAIFVRDRLPRHRLFHLLDAFRALARSPRQAARLLAWTATAAVFRVTAATAIASALGVPWSFGTGVIITAVLGLAVAIPITPGNLGIASGAVALALQSRGASLTTAVAAGLAFHAVETAVGLSFGAAGTLFLTRFPSEGGRRWGLRLAGSACGVVLVAAVGASVLPDLG